jgi:DNA-binding Lrp family transcriptional regulator
MDNTDKKLISMLQANGRVSLSEMGEALGMSHVAVSKRLDKLVKADLVKVTAGINSEYGSSRENSRKICSLPAITYVCTSDRKVQSFCYDDGRGYMESRIDNWYL